MPLEMPPIGPRSSRTSPKVRLMLRRLPWRFAIRNIPEFNFACWCGWSDDDIQLYVDRYAESDLVAHCYCPVAGRHRVSTDFDLCSREETESSLAFREFYARKGAVHGIGAIFLVTPTGQATLSLARDSDAGPFGAAELAILRTLSPHLRRAALLHTELSSQRTQLATFTGHLDRYPHAFLLTDAAGRVPVRQ